MMINVVPTILYSAMMGVIISALARTAWEPRYKQNKYLTGLLFLLFIHIAGELYIYSGVYRYAPSIAGFQLPIRMLLGPALYFYAFTAMLPTRRVTLKSQLIALSGPLIIVVVMIPFVFSMSSEQKLALANPSTRDHELWKVAIFTCATAAITFILFTFAYLFAAFVLHAKHKQQLMDKYSAIEQRSMDWLRVLLFLWGLVWLFYAADYALTFFGVKWLSISVFLPVFELGVLISFVQLAFKQIQLTESEKSSEPMVTDREAIISQDKMGLIANKLTSAMVEQSLYKDEDLSLNSLSNHISVSENHISETLSQYLETNFFQFVNRYRVEEAKALLTNSEKLVSTIAYEVGFKSKSTFNSAFKKQVGETPTAYKKSFQYKKSAIE